MKTDLSHLPERKRFELEVIVRTIREEFEVEMIILFGSYARGDWAEERGPDGVYYQYRSDFDILVIVDDKKLAKKRREWNKMEDYLDRSSSVSTPVVIITDNIAHFNYELERGHYFYSDIKKEGVMLYDSGRHTLAEPRKMSPEERKKKAEKDFKQWFDSAVGFYEQYQHAFTKQLLKIAAFELHQATERLYSAILLVYTGYKPKTHDLKLLGERVAAEAPDFLKIFPKGTVKERDRFELLKNAYVDARYDENYQIFEEDLKWLGERVSELQKMTEEKCRERIESFANVDEERSARVWKNWDSR
jgi:predicted nucleotidyltransferase/HEPN domain-containing protein